MQMTNEEPKKVTNTVGTFCIYNIFMKKEKGKTGT